MFSKILKHKYEILIIVLVLAISGFSHAYNLFNYPYYENDEGVYMSQAWSLLKQGQLAPYTYWYDHAPAGWIFIALWVKLTGGFFTFGTSVNSGRVFMLVLHLLSTFLLYWIAKKLTKNPMSGIIAALIFSLSPLGIHFQRRVLLDNIMVFWVLLSLAVLLKQNLKIIHVLISSVFFGIAVLTKENAIFFIPAFLYITYTRSIKQNRIFSFTLWLAVSGIVISFYFVYAFLKKELFPVGFLGNTTEHVSLLTSLGQQLSRGSESGSFWQEGSIFRMNFIEWIERDVFTITIGAVATMVSLLVGIKEKYVRIPAFVSVLFWAFLIRGSLVLDFYVVPLIPLLALNIGVVTTYFVSKISPNVSINKLLTLAVLGIFLFFLLTPTSEHYVRNETVSQVRTIEWIKENLEEDDYIVIDNSIWIDLRDERFPGDKTFSNADWSWKVEKDKEIYVDKLETDWRNIEYIALSHEILRQIREDEFNFIEQAYLRSSRVAHWSYGSKSYIDLANNISTNGDWMSIYKVDNRDKIALDTSWNYYKNNYIKSYGKVIDPQNGRTTSEGQSYALLRSVWQKDKSTFEGVLKWTNDNLNHRLSDNLISWSWGVDNNGNEKLLDSASASDADIDTALALLFAHRLWDDNRYLIQAIGLINDIWENEVVEIDGVYYLTAGSDSDHEDYIIVNPSYFSPAHYRIFAEVDDRHDWDKLADDTYYVLGVLEQDMEITNGLYPNWVLVTKENTEMISAQDVRQDSDVYGYDSFRLPWRIALDAEWFEHPQAIELVKRYHKFYSQELDGNGQIYAAYDMRGRELVDYSDISTDAVPLTIFSVVDKELANSFYKNHIENKFVQEEGYWGDKDNYYNQNWAWFGLAFYSNHSQNLWGVDKRIVRND